MENSLPPFFDAFHTDDDTLYARDKETGQLFRVALRGHVTEHHKENRDGKEFLVVDNYEIDSIDMIPVEETCQN